MAFATAFGALTTGAFIAGFAKSLGASNALTNHFIDSGTVFVDAGGVANYVAAMQGITKTLFGSFEKTYLTCKS